MYLEFSKRGPRAYIATHIKGRLLDQAVILFNCVPFRNGNFSLRKEFASLRSVPYGMENHFYHIR